jgi:hypothetical protein
LDLGWNVSLPTTFETYLSKHCVLIGFYGRYFRPTAATGRRIRCRAAASPDLPLGARSIFEVRVTAMRTIQTLGPCYRSMIAKEYSGYTVRQMIRYRQALSGAFLCMIPKPFILFIYGRLARNTYVSASLPDRPLSRRFRCIPLVPGSCS